MKEIRAPSMAASHPSHPALVLILVLFLSASAQEDLRLQPAEQEAAYNALESINPTVDWRSLYPDDLCLSGPHGIVCDYFPTAAAGVHVTELNFGYVSDYSNNPPCGANATLPSLLPFRFLRKLFLYSCFTSNINTPLPSAFWSPPPSLEELVLLNNPSLVGRLSGESFTFLPSLRRLVISGTGISGFIPPQIGLLKDLTQLVLSHNRLRGGIPPSIAQCARLRILDASGNRLNGRIPGEIGRLEELLKLDLSSNRISGRIPAELGRLKKLEFLDLSSNRFAGGVPVAIGEMAALRDMYLSGNGGVGGRIPEMWEKLGGIVGLGMAGMGLKGSIPASMGVFLGRVSYLSLAGNELEGELPAELRRLEATAGEVDLANNRFHGRIPFSAVYVGRMGGKLKLGGNRGLCLEVEVRPRVLDRCNGNGTEIPQPALFSPSMVSLQSPLFWLLNLSFLHLVWLLK